MRMTRRKRTIETKTETSIDVLPQYSYHQRPGWVHGVGIVCLEHHAVALGIPHTPARITQWFCRAWTRLLDGPWERPQMPWVDSIRPSRLHSIVTIAGRLVVRTRGHEPRVLAARDRGQSYCHP